MEHVGLRDVADAGTQLGIVLIQVTAPVQHLPDRCGAQAGQGLQQRGLARA